VIKVFFSKKSKPTAKDLMVVTSKKYEE